MEPTIAESKELNQTPAKPFSMLVSDDNNVVVATNAGNDKKIATCTSQTDFQLD